MCTQWRTLVTGVLFCSLAGLANADASSDPQQKIKEQFWGQLYSQGGQSLFCQQELSGQQRRFTASAIYTSKQIRGQLHCLTDNQCAEQDRRYPNMVSDLHNLYPELTRVELVRRNSKFGSLGTEVPSKFDDISCDLKVSFQMLEPRDGAKGNVARALFYMHQQYGLAIPGSVELYKAWNRMDPPDEAEKARNEQIASIQGTRNPFIDNPELGEQVQ